MGAIGGRVRRGGEKLKGVVGLRGGGGGGGGDLSCFKP